MRLALVLLLLQDPSLVDQLGDDDPAVRGAAFEALEKRGGDAIPDIEKALKHSSPEVRLRAAELLNRLPRFQGRHLEKHPEFARAKRMWNGLIDCVIHKKPVPAALWKELGDPVIYLGSEPADEAPRPHPDPWILAQLAERGGTVLRYFAQKYGVEGSRQDLLIARQSNSTRPVPRNLLPRLAALRPDRETLEEIYAALLILRHDGLTGWAHSFADGDWDTALLFLVRIRRRLDAKPVEPYGMEDVLRGPWVRGIARGLGRAFANDGKKYDRASCLEPNLPPPPEKSRWSGVERIYAQLLDLERDISRCWFWRDRLRPAKAAIPRGKPELPEAAKEVLPRLGLHADGRAVVAAILEELPSRRWNETEISLLREIGRQVAREASK